MESVFTPLADILCMDFANTRQRIRRQDVDFIPDFPHFVQLWLEFGLITPSIQSTLLNNWGSFEQNRAISAARSFREILRKFLAELVERGKVEFIPDEINEILSFQSGYTSIVKSSNGFELKTYRDFTLPEHLLSPIAESAAWLICNGDWKMAKVCSNPECGLFFYDITKNHRRRWCSMQTCGNRSKVEAYLKRKHGGVLE